MNFETAPQFHNTQPGAPLVAEGNKERREVRRQRVLKGGSIFFNSGYASYQCTVKNLSKAGALLKLGDTSGLPTEFDFLIKGEKQKSRAKLIWRTRDSVGIHLIDESASA